MEIHNDYKKFARRIKWAISLGGRYAFFIGAGCSVTSGIPDAKTLTEKWLSDLHYIEVGKTGDFKEWVDNEYPDCRTGRSARYYKDVKRKLFHFNAEIQRGIEGLTRGKEPGEGYITLAGLTGSSLTGKHFNPVITTNFDDLIEEAFIKENIEHLKIIQEQLAGYTKIYRGKPIIIKLHGDVCHQSLINTDDMDYNSELLKELLSDMGIIFTGYGGNDKSILNLLKEMPKEALNWGVYWVNEQLPYDGEMVNWLENRNAVWVKHSNFDQLMLYFAEEFRKPPDAIPPSPKPPLPDWGKIQKTWNELGLSELA